MSSISKYIHMYIEGMSVKVEKKKHNLKMLGLGLTIWKGPGDAEQLFESMFFR